MVRPLFKKLQNALPPSLLRRYNPPPPPPPVRPAISRDPAALRHALIGRDVFVPASARPGAAIPGAAGPGIAGVSPLAANRTTGEGRDANFSEAVGRVWNDVQSGGGGTLLADQLRGDSLSQEEKRALIDLAIRSGNANEILTDFRHGAEERNFDYDDLTTISAAVADAYRAGVITDEELRDFAEQLGPEGAAQFAAQLALDPENTRVGGVVEAFGREAQALGYDQAAAIAFSASPALVRANLPTDAQQREAFGHVRAYLDGADRSDFSNEDQALYTVVAGNAVRLSANGNGFSDSELQSFIGELGPSLAGEVVSRLRNVPGDTRAEGAVEAFGRAAREVAAGAGGEDREAWELNAAIAFTSSRALIDRNLQGDDALRAFELLSEATAEGLDTADGADGRYSLLRYPEILQGAALLFDVAGEAIIDASLRGENGLSPQHLEDFIQTVGFSPHSSATAKRQVRDAITGYVEDHVQIGPEHDEGQLSFEVGQLLGITQNAADAAIERVGDNEAARVSAENDARAFFVSLGTALITRGISSWNPIVGAIAGPVTRELLERVVPQQDVDAARVAAEQAFEAELARQGTNPDLGQALKVAQEAYLRVLNDAILNQLQSGNLTQEEHNQLSTALHTLASIQLELDNGYSEQRPG